MARAARSGAGLIRLWQRRHESRNRRKDPGLKPESFNDRLIGTTEVVPFRVFVRDSEFRGATGRKSLRENSSALVDQEDPRVVSIAPTGLKAFVGGLPGLCSRLRRELHPGLASAAPTGRLPLRGLVGKMFSRSH